MHVTLDTRPAASFLGPYVDLTTAGKRIKNIQIKKFKHI